MYAISQWLKEVALVAYGVTDENKRADLLRGSGGMAAADLSERQVAALKGFDRLPQALKSPGQAGMAEALRDSAFLPTLDLAIKSKFHECYGGGLHKHGVGEDPVLAETMTAQHFATYFGTALSRAFFPSYEYEVGSWTNYTTPDVVPDFRDVDRMRMSTPGTLYKRRDKQQVAATSIAETVIHYGVEQYGRQFDISWEALQNDDLGEIAKTPMEMANAARRWLDGWVSALYDNATTQAALLALGLVYGGTGRLTAANLAIGVNAMRQRTDVNGNALNIRRISLVIPPVLEIQARTILQNILSYGSATSNVLGQFISGIYVDPYIAFTSPNVPWYLIADPRELPGITVARLQGWNGPVVRRTSADWTMLSGSAPAPFNLSDFHTGDIEYSVDDIVGGWDDATYVGVTDFRAIYYSNGTTV